MDNNSFYEEIGKNYRFFLSWRYGVFVAYFVLIGGTINFALSALKINDNIAGLILLIASFISIIIWFADCRTRDIYRELTKIGENIENENQGAYTTLNKLKLDKFSIFSQSMTIDSIFLLTFLSFFAFGFILLTTEYIVYDAVNSLYKLKDDIKVIHLILSFVIPVVLGGTLIKLRDINYQDKPSGKNQSKDGGNTKS